MTITDQQRREVAARLRWAATGAYKHLPMVDLLASVAGANVSAMGKGKAKCAVYARLAYIVDRPACHAAQAAPGGFYECSRCGYDGWAYAESVTRYCPSCGAEVVE